MTVQITPHSIKREIKDTLTLSFPLMMAWLIYSLGPFAGTAMVAHLGENVLAASVLVATIWFAAMTLCFGVFHSVSILISQQMGAKNNTAISEMMGQAFLLCVISWFPVMLVMYLVPFLVHWSAPNKEILHYATQYSHALMWAAPGLSVLGMIEHFLSGIGRTKLSLAISLIEVPLEIITIYLFVFGKLGLPAFGIAGVGYGLAVSYALTTVVVLLFLNFSKLTRQFEIYKYVGRFNWRYFKEMLRIGMPIGLTYFIELVSFTIATYFISRFNATSLAAHQIVLQFEGVIINIPYALSQGVSIRVGQSVGRQDKTGVRYASYVGLGLCMGAAVLLFILLTCCSRLLIGIDLDLTDPNNAVLIKETMTLFVIVGFYLFFDTIRVAEAGALRGLKDTKYTMMINVTCFFGLGLLMAYLFGIVLQGNVYGVWLGLAGGVILCSLMLFLRLRKIIGIADLSRILHIA
jgi:MATE family multidrug resistance protein